MKRPESEEIVMKLLGAVIYFSKHVPNMHVILALLYTILHNDVSFHWNTEQEVVFLQFKQTLKQSCELLLPKNK